MAAGLGFKTFTTGEVLTAADTNGYLMQGINVFASTAARDAAITSPQEGQFAYTKDTNSLWYYTGSAWAASGATGDIEGVTAGIGISGGGTSGTVTVTNSMATAIDAKGDLIAGTAADTFDRLAVGTNGQTLVANSSTSTGLEWQTPGGSFGTWTTWTPTLTASTTNPTLGTGSITAGRYVQNGKVVTAVAYIQFGSSGAAAGTGSYRVSLPVNATAYTRSYGMGSGAFIDVSAANGYLLMPQVEATTYCTFRIQGGAYGDFNATNPVAPSNNDQIHLFFTYEVA